jgi:hypothetical protein
MRTTIDLPDALYRKTKAIAALRGLSMKDVIARAIEREVAEAQPAKRKAHYVKLPLIPWKSDRKLDLTDFNFDDLLG